MVSFSGLVAIVLLSVGSTSAAPKSKVKASSTVSPTPKTTSGIAGTSTCPPFTIGTTTVTTQAYAGIFTTPSTIQTYTETVYPHDPNVVTINYVDTTYVYPGTSSFTAYTFLSYTVTVLPAKKTVTEPTHRGFTPLLCESAYYQKTLTSTTTTTFTNEYTSTVTTTETTQTYTDSTFIATATVTSTLDYDYTTGVYATSTSTLTRTEATHTVYAACATNNRTPNYPGGGGFQMQTTNYGPSVGYQTVEAADDVDCCGLCQADSSCVASYYYTGVFLNAMNCMLYTKNTTQYPTCDPTFKGIDAYSPAYDPGLIASNGRCGQIAF